MAADLPAWPNGATVAVSLTFDVDAETGALGDGPEFARRLTTLSEGRFGVTRGMPRILALLAELVSGSDREQHRFPLGLVRSVFLAVELDERDVFLLHDQIAGVRTARENRWS